MSLSPIKFLVVATSALALTACATPELTDPERGFSDVAEKTRSTLRKDSVWIQSRPQADAVAARVRGMIHKQTISANTAVQAAILSNKGLQAAYAEIGMSAADVWQEALLPNPRVSVSLSELGVGRIIETIVAQNIAALISRDARLSVAEAKLRRSQLQALAATLKVASEARMAWIKAVSAWEQAGHIRQAVIAADAGSELAKQLGGTGAIPKAAQAREHANYADITVQLAKARLSARGAKQELIRKMGVWGRDTQFKVPNKLPPLPLKLKIKRSVAAEALRNRIDLLIALADLEILARSHGLVKATRFVSDFDIAGGFEVTKPEEGAEDPRDVYTGNLEFEFAIPIFDSGEAKLRKAERAYMRAANIVAQKAIEIRSEARSAYEAYRGRHDIARHYRKAVVPLHRVIEQQALLTNNGMITNTFELLADVRAKLNADLQSDRAKQDFWLADASLDAALYGAGPDMEEGEEEEFEIAEAEGGDE